MTYKGYEIYASVRSYDIWTISDDEELDDWLSEDLGGGLDVVGYWTNDNWFEDIEEAKDYIDGLTRKEAKNGVQTTLRTKI